MKKRKRHTTGRRDELLLGYTVGWASRWVDKAHLHHWPCPSHTRAHVYVLALILSFRSSFTPPSLLYHDHQHYHHFCILFLSMDRSLYPKWLISDAEDRLAICHYIWQSEERLHCCFRQTFTETMSEMERLWRECSAIDWSLDKKVQCDHDIIKKRDLQAHGSRRL